MATYLRPRGRSPGDLLADRTALFRLLATLTVQPPVFTDSLADLVQAPVANPSPSVLTAAVARADARIQQLSLRRLCDTVFSTVMDVLIRQANEAAEYGGAQTAGGGPDDPQLRAATCGLALLGEFFATIGQPQPAEVDLFRSLVYPKPTATLRMRTAIGLPDFDGDEGLLLSFLRDKALRIICLICVAAERAGELRATEMNAGAGGKVSVDFLADVLSVVPQVSRRPAPASVAPARAELVWLGASAQVPVGNAPRAPSMSSASAAEAARWRQQATDLDAQVNNLRLELAHAKAQNDEEQLQPQYADQLRGLRARIHWLESASGGAIEREATATATEAPPTVWDELWPVVERQMAGRLVISRKAARAARRSHYEDVPFAWRVIRLLAEDYVPMRRGEPGTRERFEEGCRELKVAVSPTGRATLDRKYRDAYQVNHLGQYLTLDMHVQGSDSRDPLECFRLYFTYAVPDDGLGYVLVGHLPTHLENSLE